MLTKSSIQLKLSSFAQKNERNSRLVNLIRAPLSHILLISGIIRGIYYSELINTQSVDTATYINYHANILKGETDALRTPVYPYFIKLIGLFGQQNLVDHVVKAQILISFLSIILFYKIVQSVFKKTPVIFASSLLYGAMLPVINFDKMVLTESLSVNCGLLFIFLLVRYLNEPSALKAWGLTLLAFIAIMLRPSFIYLLPLVIAFWVLRLLIHKKDRKTCISGLVASAVVILLIAGYSQLNERNYKYNGISVVSNNNEIGVITSANIYDYGNDSEISARIHLNMEAHKSKGKGINIMKLYTPDRVHQFIVTCIKNQPKAYAFYIGGKLLDLQATNIFTNYPDHKLNWLAYRFENIEYLVFCVTFNILYGFIVLSLLLIIISWVKSRQVPWLKIVLWLMIFLQVAVAIMGGYSEYPRLILPAMPALIILLFYYIDQVVFAIDRDKLKKYPDY